MVARVCGRAGVPPWSLDQDHLDLARQMQTLSFVMHIPLVCFAIAFPAMVLFVEWLWLRTGDELYRTLARRWSRVLVALFAVGVVTGTILSFEMGLLWPGFTGTFGAVFGLGFAVEGFSFFAEAIFIGIYVYGWDRLSPRAHLAAGIPVVLAGVTGSLMVIAVNGWMNHPTGFAIRDGQVVDVRPVQALFLNTYFWLLLARVGAHVPGRIHGDGFCGRQCLRGGAAARALGSLRAHCAGRPADRGGVGLAGADPGR